MWYFMCFQQISWFKITIETQSCRKFRLFRSWRSNKFGKNLIFRKYSCINNLGFNVFSQRFWKFSLVKLSSSKKSLNVQFLLLQSFLNIPNDPFSKILWVWRLITFINAILIEFIVHFIVQIDEKLHSLMIKVWIASRQTFIKCWTFVFSFFNNFWFWWLN